MLLYGGVAVAGLALASFGLAPAVGFLVAAALINGFALEAGGLAWVSALQEVVPNEMLGRVASIDQLGSFAFLPIGFALAGWATSTLSAQAVFLLGGMATAGIACMAAVHPAVRRFR
jgi:DHA3 family tetracycline resistance protein-like MFS transporter